MGKIPELSKAEFPHVQHTIIMKIKQIDIPFKELAKCLAFSKLSVNVKFPLVINIIAIDRHSKHMARILIQNELKMYLGSKTQINHKELKNMKYQHGRIIDVGKKKHCENQGI